MSLISKIESILFVASKPLDFKVIAKAIGKTDIEVEELIETLKMKYNRDDSGIHILQEGKQVEMATNPENIDSVDMFIKDEISSELTKAQLETLTVIAYREPITRPELEQIRGVNCSLIIRNLLIRGLINEKDSKEKIMPVYSLSFEALRHLGVDSASDLPDYSNLSKHENIEKTLETEEVEGTSI